MALACTLAPHPRIGRPCGGGAHTVPAGGRQAGAVSCSAGHGNFPYLCGNLNDVVVSPLLYTCYQNSQSVSRAYEQCGASAVQPISEEMQLLLTVYYLVQLGECPAAAWGRRKNTPRWGDVREPRS